MNEARFAHTATLLPNGKVLVTGGTNESGLLASAELYDPTTQSWTATAGMVDARANHTATPLPDGNVLVAGGDSGRPGGPLTSAESYDPSSGSWNAAGNLTQGRTFHTATLLPNGAVLVAAGGGGSIGQLPLASAELYDPSTGSWTATGNLARSRWFHTATPLPDGKVLVAGGQSYSNSKSRYEPQRSAELYDPSTGSWTASGNMDGGRYGHTATLLLDGMVLVAGGSDNDSGWLASAMLYDPTTRTWTATERMDGGRAGHTATLLVDGTVLVAGGASQDGRLLASAELYWPGGGS